MPEDIKKRVIELRTGKIEHSYRSIAEKIYDEFPNYVRGLYGDGIRENQLFGEDLCKDAGV